VTRGRPGVGLVTCAVLPEPDPDAAPLAEALEAAGLDSVAIPWDAEHPAGAVPGLCVFRSCWNAHERPEEFLSWLGARSGDTRLLNPPPLVRWNFHKKYLLELARAGVPVVPTRLFRRGEPGATLPEGPGWEDVVVKPAISAASWRTHRFRAGARSDAASFLSSLLAERDAMVQPYQAAIETAGERAIVWIDGAVTHAVRKSPRFSGADESVSPPLPVTAEERRIAERAIDHVARRFGAPLYARADLVPDATGRLRLSELELFEPSLFLAREPAALARFVGAIAREAADSRRPAGGSPA
jgi:hypothetical protein